MCTVCISMEEVQNKDSIELNTFSCFKVISWECSGESLKVNG